MFAYALAHKTETALLTLCPRETYEKKLAVQNIRKPFPKGAYLVSQTDPKGVIVSVNKAFADISGFSESELVGSPHNIVLHPDMPAEAFADMWQTLKDGHPWRAAVKNRSKDRAPLKFS